MNSKDYQRSKTDTLTNGGDDGPTEEEGIGQIPSAGEIRRDSGIQTSLNRSNHLLQRLVFSGYSDDGGGSGDNSGSTYRGLSSCSSGYMNCKQPILLQLGVCFFILSISKTFYLGTSLATDATNALLAIHSQ